MGTSVSGLFGLRPDARLADLDFKDAEVAQFHLVALGERLGDVIEGFLHHVKNLLLDEAGFVADADDKVAFCQSHSFYQVALIITELHGLSRSHWLNFHRLNKHKAA